MRPLATALLLALDAATASGLDVGVLRTYDGAVTDGEYAFSCAVVGDMDGDGLAEFAIGAPGDSTAGAGAGRVFIYRGGSPPPDAAAWVIPGQAGDLLGYALSAADADGDGLADLLMGAPGSPAVVPGTTGRALVAFGSNPLGARAPLNIPGSAPLGRFGAAIAGLGRFNGDLYDDFAVGAPDASNDAGEVHVFYGGTTVPTSPALVLHGRFADDNFGTAVAGAGRTRGGSEADLLVGAPFNSQATVWGGRAYLYLGGAAPDTVPDRFWSGAAAGDNLGFALAGAGDVNGDGRDDFLIGAPQSNVGSMIDAGRAYLYLGAIPPPSAPALTLDGSDTQGYLGLWVEGVGDVDSDGRSDFAVAAPGGLDTNLPGEVHLHLGRAVPVAQPDSVWQGEAVEDMFGHAISSGGKIRGGNRDEFIAGSYPHAGVGRAYLYGASSTVNVSRATPAAGIRLLAPAPNPARGGFRVTVELDRAARLSLDVTDLLGRRVAALARGRLPAGRHEFASPAGGARGRGGLRAGLYWVVLETEDAHLAQKLVVVP